MKNGDYELAIAPEGYPGRLYRGKYCYMHHLVFWQNKGVVPSDNEVIHHIDGNKYNNSIDNLMLMTKKEHDELHYSKRFRKMVFLRCPVCEKYFFREKRQTHLQKNGTATYCSYECAYKANSLRRQKDEHFLNNISRNVVLQFE